MKSIKVLGLTYSENCIIDLIEMIDKADEIMINENIHSKEVYDFLDRSEKYTTAIVKVRAFRRENKCG